jgi:glycosyltransferase involved in cell wall biosynthesis
MVSIVIPTVGRPDELAATLEVLAREADWLISEVLVVVDGQLNRTESAMLCSWEKVRTVPLGQHGGVVECRNIGAQQATSKTLVFLDDDIHVTPDWAVAISDAVVSGAAVVTGPVTARDTGHISQARELRYQQRYKRLRDGDCVPFLAGGNTLIDRSVFLAAGGFPNGAVGTDNQLAKILRDKSIPVEFRWGMRVSHRHSRGFGNAVRCAWMAGRESARQKYTAPFGVPAIDWSSADRVTASALNVVLWVTNVLGRVLPIR